MDKGNERVPIREAIGTSLARIIIILNQGKFSKYKRLIIPDASKIKITFNYKFETSLKNDQSKLISDRVETCNPFATESAE